ncbi:MAG: ABC transporter permease [Candidatus Sericytochromatia bacterium]|nr:ABC transporter permease [Candidatus Sericytochromatia bacterium]
MNYAQLFAAELRREFILLSRYPFELISRLVWNLGFALMMYYGFSAIGGAGGSSLPGFHEGQMGRLLGLLITYIAINGINNTCELLGDEVQTGTLEQAALSPPPLLVIMLMRDLASFVEMLVRFALVLAIAMLITGLQFHLNIPAFILLLTLMYLGTEGIGLILGGAALLYKRVGTLAQFAVMLVFGLAILPLESLPGWVKGFVENFPFTKALVLLRQVGVQGVPLSQLFADGSVASLALNTTIYLGLGMLVFSIAERKARQLGTLNQY